MSLPRKMTVNCSKCGKPIEITVFQSVNTNYAEDIARQVITGELFNVSCSQCGFVSHLEYDILYNDMNHGAMIWVIHDNTPEFESRVAEVRKTNIVPLKMTRIVTDVNGLREKVSCLEKRRDDRIIELCKMYVTYNMLSKQPDFDFRNAYYTVDGDNEFVLLYDCDGKEYICELPEKLYDLVNDMYFNSSYPSQFDGNYAIVDSNWAEGIFHSLIKAKSEEIKAANSSKQPEKVPDNNHVLRCSKCNKELPADSEFCQYCGNKISEAMGETTVLEEPSHKDFIDNKSPQMATIQGNKRLPKINIRLAIIVTAILALVLTIGFVIGYAYFEDTMLYANLHYDSTGGAGCVGCGSNICPYCQGIKIINSEYRGPYSFPFYSKISNDRTVCEILSVIFGLIAFVSTIAYIVKYCLIKKLSKKKLTAPILISVSVIILIAVVALGILEFKYQLACSKLENGFYEDAIELFEDLDGYKKSYAKIQEAKDEQFKHDNNLADYIECTIAELYFNPNKYNGKKVAVSSWKVACKYYSETVAGTFYDFLLCDNLTHYEDKSDYPISPIYKYYVDCIEPYGTPYIGARVFSDVIYAEIPENLSVIKIYGTFTYNPSCSEGGYISDPHVYNVDVDNYTFE